MWKNLFILVFWSFFLLVANITHAQNSPQNNLLYTKQLIEKGEYALAEVSLRKQLSTSLKAYILLAEVYLYEGKFFQALDFLEQARTQGLRDNQYYALRGRIALMQGDFDTAWSALRSAVVLSGGREDALYWGITGLAEGDVDRASLGLNKLSSGTASANAAFLSGLALLPENPEKALAEFRSAQAELDSQSPLKPQAIYWQARALERLGRITEARSTLRFLLRLYPNYTPARTALNRLGP